MITIEILYALPNDQTLYVLTLEEGSTVLDALLKSPLQARYPEVDFLTLKVGIFGQIKSFDTPLSTGNRIEFYRPLLINPMDKRRTHAKATGYQVGRKKP